MARTYKIVPRLHGRTIKKATRTCHQKTGCDCDNLLILEMTDNSVFHIEGYYGGYTGKNCDEYTKLISVTRKCKGYDDD